MLFRSIRFSIPMIINGKKTNASNHIMFKILATTKPFKAYLAQALLDHPNMIILDEATASLDPAAKEELMGLIKHLNQEHKITVCQPD